MNGKKGSSFAPGEIPIYIDGELLAPGRSVVGMFPASNAPGYLFQIFTDSEDPRWKQACDEAQEGRIW